MIDINRADTMESLYFGLLLVFVATVIVWAVNNDGVGDDGDQIGLLALRPDDAERANRKPDRRYRRAGLGRGRHERIKRSKFRRRVE